MMQNDYERVVFAFSDGFSVEGMLDRETINAIVAGQTSQPPKPTHFTHSDGRRYLVTKVAFGAKGQPTVFHVDGRVPESLAPDIAGFSIRA